MTILNAMFGNQYLTRHIHQISLFLQSWWNTLCDFLFSNYKSRCLTPNATLFHSDSIDFQAFIEQPAVIGIGFGVCTTVPLLQTCTLLINRLSQ